MTRYFLKRGRGSKSIALDALLGEGAAGCVYKVDGAPGVAAKIYHAGSARAEHEAKIDMMLANPPALQHLRQDGVDYPQIAWPQAKLYAGDGGFAGFLMPEIDFGRSTSLVNLLQKSSRRAERLSEYYGYRVLVARNLASVIAALHEAGHHMIDMKPANLRFYPTTSWMAVVDTDGFSIAGRAGRSPATQVSDEYIAPENFERRPAELGVEQDRFALGVIIFQLLNNGLHPYAGGGGQGIADIQGRIQANAYAYGLIPRRDVKPSAASLHRMFKRTTREMFDRAFGARDPRPTAEQWRDHLDWLLGELIPCSAKPAEHVHFGGGCGFCAHEARVEGVAAATRRARRPSPPSRERVLPLRQAVAGASPQLTRPIPSRSSAMRRSHSRSIWPVALSTGSIAAVALLAYNFEIVASLFPDTGVAPTAIAASGIVNVPAPAVSTTVPGNPVLADCGAQATAVDRQVCASAELLVAERRIADRYTTLVARAEGYSRLFLIEDQALWADRRARCGTATDIAQCLADAYRGRLGDLEAWPDDNRAVRARRATAAAPVEPVPHRPSLSVKDQLVELADR